MQSVIPSSQDRKLGLWAARICMEVSKRRCKRNISKVRSPLTGGHRARDRGFSMRHRHGGRFETCLIAFDDLKLWTQLPRQAPYTKIDQPSSSANHLDRLAAASGPRHGRCERIAGSRDWWRLRQRARVKSDARMPFGGDKEHNGYGRELGEGAFAEFVNIKTVGPK